MKLLLILAPLIVGLLAAIATILVGGMLMPKAHTVARSVRLPAAPEAVWATITDFPRHPEWRPKVRTVERLADSGGNPTWVEINARGERLPLEVIESQSPRVLKTRIADPKLPFGGTWTYELSAEGGGTRLRITEDGEIYNPAFRYISRIIGQAATVEGYLRALAKRMGSAAAIEA